MAAANPAQCNTTGSADRRTAELASPAPRPAPGAPHRLRPTHLPAYTAQRDQGGRRGGGQRGTQHQPGQPVTPVWHPIPEILGRRADPADAQRHPPDRPSTVTASTANAPPCPARSSASTGATPATAASIPAAVATAVKLARMPAGHPQQDRRTRTAGGRGEQRMRPAGGPGTARNAALHRKTSVRAAAAGCPVRSCTARHPAAATAAGTHPVGGSAPAPPATHSAAAMLTPAMTQ
jgi:hypothetical protein